MQRKIIYKTSIITIQIDDPSQQKIEKPLINSVNILFCVLQSLSRDNVNIKNTSIDQYGLLPQCHLIYAGSTKPDELIKKEVGTQECILALKTAKPTNKKKNTKKIKTETWFKHIANVVTCCWAPFRARQEEEESFYAQG